MTVECPACKTIFPVDPNKVPPGGVHARCSACSQVFFVEPPTTRPAQEAEIAEVLSAPEGDASMPEGVVTVEETREAPREPESAFPEQVPVEHETEEPEPDLSDPVSEAEWHVEQDSAETETGMPEPETTQSEPISEAEWSGEEESLEAEPEPEPISEGEWSGEEESVEAEPEPEPISEAEWSGEEESLEAEPEPEPISEGGMVRGGGIRRGRAGT
jgi:predicted Zn finger-like uncharacterized protein